MYIKRCWMILKLNIYFINFYLILINSAIKKNFFLLLYYKKKNMAGGLMQLVAYGAQDIYLTGNP